MNNLSDESFERFTIIIPTHDRPERLRRLLQYYTDQKINVIVADSSEEKYLYLTEHENLIKYKHFPGIHYVIRIYEIISLINTPYVLMCGDDDFIIPETINNIIDFLELNPDYSTGQGIYNRFKYNNGRFEFFFIKKNYREGYDQGTPSERLVYMMNNYRSFFYSVHKTSVFLRAFTNIMRNGQAIITNYTLWEYYYALNQIIEGKHYVHSSLYIVREAIKGSAGKITDNLEVTASKRKYLKEYKAFISLTSEHLSQVEKIPVKTANNIIKKSINNHLDIEYRKSKKYGLSYFIKKTAKIKKWRILYLIIRIFKLNKTYNTINKNDLIVPFSESSYLLNAQDVKNFDLIKKYLFNHEYIYKE